MDSKMSNKLAFLACFLLFLANYVSAGDDPPTPPEDFDFGFDLEVKQPRSVVKRAAGGGRYLACEMLIAIDEPLYVHYQRKMDNVTQLVTDLVARMNQIYHDTIWNGGEFGHLYFRIKEVRILYDFCTECNHTQQVYLSEFSRIDFSDFCLAHVFTYRDFPEGVQGLAWKGTLCQPRFNTGFTTLLNHQIAATRADSAMTLTHEIGHNLGSDHDEQIGCTSDYIMSESGSSHSHPQFSSCSGLQITALVRNVLASPRRNCFVEKPESDPPDFSICGDGIVEGDEECDCGMSYLTCFDPCCYAAHIHWADLLSNHSATPCRRNSKPVCLHPFQSAWTFGFVIPWIFIFLVVAIASIGLLHDWRNQRRFFTHVTQPSDMIRSETAEQMAKRIQRQNLRGENIYVLKANSNGVRPPPPPPPPASIARLPREAPRTGLVQQIRGKIEGK